MKAITIQLQDNLDNFGFDVLSLEKLHEVRGGGTPRSRDKDIFDFEEE